MMSLLHDTKHLIQTIEGKMATYDTVLVTLDVNALSTSIPHDDIRITVEKVLNLWSDMSPLTFFSFRTIRFNFGEKFLKIWTAVLLSNMWSGHWELCSSFNCKLVYGLTGGISYLQWWCKSFFNHIENYGRFIDDILLLYNDKDSRSGVFWMAK